MLPKAVPAAAAVQLQLETLSAAVQELGVWPSLVTRQIPLNSEEGRSAKAVAAREKELAGHRRRGTWDEGAVREYGDLLRDPTKKEAMIGRAFGILGNKHDDLPEDQQEMKFRSAFQGNNIRTKNGVSATELFEEMANAPASFTAIRCALAVVALKGFSVTIRDALQAYLQARISDNGRVETWVELPQDWWPAEWFADPATRAKPLYRRPVVKLILALHGHPESGPLWDQVLSCSFGSRLEGDRGLAWYVVAPRRQCLGHICR